MRYYKPKSNEWQRPKTKDYRLQCCDCGLVHSMDFRVVKGRAEFRARRNNRATAAVRRNFETIRVIKGKEAKKRYTFLVERSAMRQLMGVMGLMLMVVALTGFAGCDSQTKDRLSDIQYQLAKINAGLEDKRDVLASGLKTDLVPCDAKEGKYVNGKLEFTDIQRGYVYREGRYENGVPKDMHPTTHCFKCEKAKRAEEKYVCEGEAGSTTPAPLARDQRKD